MASRPIVRGDVHQRSAYVNFVGERCLGESLKTSGVEQNGFWELLGGSQKAVLRGR